MVRDFGEEGVFTATVTAFRKEGLDDIYAIEYEDGDVEELGEEDHNGHEATYA